MVIFQTFSFIFSMIIIYVLYHLVSRCVTDIGLSSTPKINIRFHNLRKNYTRKKTFTIFTFSKNVHTCPTWILMWKYLEYWYSGNKTSEFENLQKVCKINFCLGLNYWIKFNIFGAKHLKNLFRNINFRVFAVFPLLWGTVRRVAHLSCLWRIF